VSQAATDWDPRWRKFGLGNYALTTVGYVVAIAGTQIPPVPGRVSGVNAFDAWASDDLSYHLGGWARSASDVLLVTSIAFPLVIDPLVAYYARGKSETSWQIALITAEALSVNLMLQSPTAGLVSRERPYGRECGSTLDPASEECTDSNRYRSFYSGHTSTAFTMASITCSHHFRHRLFGGAWDAVACAAALLTAGSVAALRVSGSKHYLTDILTGATLGGLTGTLVPWLLHYRSTESDEPSVTLAVAPTKDGLVLSGAF